MCCDWEGLSCNSGSSGLAGGPLGNSKSPDVDDVSSCDDGTPDVGGRSLCNGRVPDSGSKSSCNGGVLDVEARSLYGGGNPDAGGCTSSCDGEVPEVAGRSLPTCGKGCNDPSPEFPRFSNPGITSLTMSRDLKRTIAGAATASWTTERIRRIRAAVLSRRISQN